MAGLIRLEQFQQKCEAVFRLKTALGMKEARLIVAGNRGDMTEPFGGML